MVVPCGRCPFCAATRRSDWATRLDYEARLHSDKKFVTLTYADPHLTFKYGNPQLVKADLQGWFKRVRKSGAKIRYYAVGEYGSKTYRPHYHVLLFGAVEDDVLMRCWPYGLVHIGTVTQASVMYCLGYIVNAKSWQMLHNRVRPFSLMSKGIGKNYLTPDMVRWHKSERKNYVLVDGVKRHLPRYYKTRIFSKIDQVRIAVRDQKALYKQMVEWIRAPSQMKMKDPMKYRDLQMRTAAKKILRSSKENLSI